MAVEGRLLIFSAIPHPDESFVGYLLRLTERNHYETLSWILQFAEIKQYVRSKFALASIGSLNLSPLKKLIGIKESKLKTLLYPPVKSGGKLHDYSIFGNRIPPYIIRLRYPKVCPLCLRESAYLRKIWELAAITVCPVHKSMLLDECPSCNERITWSRSRVSKCKCKFDWREYESPVLGDEELEVARQVYKLCNLLSDSRANYDRPRIDCPLNKLDLDQSLSSLFFIAGQFNGLMDIRGKRVATSLRNLEIHRLLCKAYDVFQNWPNNFFSFLDWKRANNPDTRHVRGLRRDFGQYKSALYVQLSSSCYNFLREAFEEYIAVYWDGGYITTLSRLSETARLKKRYLTKIEVKRMLNITPKSVDGLIAAGRLNIAKQNGSAPNIVLIESTSAQQLQEKLKDAFNFKQTGVRLGLHRTPVLELVESGLLNPLRGPTVDGCSDWKFSQEEVDNLLESLEAKVQRANPHNKRGTLDLGSTLMKVRRVGGSCGTLAQAILQRVIVPCDKSGKPGLSGFLFTAEQIANYVLDELRLQVGEVHSIRDVAMTLKVSEMTAYFFVKTGILKASTYSRIKSPGLLITEEEVNNFVSNYYVLTGSNAQELGTHTTYIASLLADKGIKPVSARDVDGGPLRVYKRSDIAQINLPNLISSARPKNFKRRINPGIFSLSEVGKFLGVKSRTARKLVENGFIKPYVRRAFDMKGEDKYYVPYKLMEKCKHIGIMYTSLLSTQVAAKVIGISRLTLLHYVKSGRLSPIFDEDGSNNYYFLKDDIKALGKLRKTTIQTGEAAKVLCISRAVLFEWTVKGIITPISGPRVDGSVKNLYLKKDVDKLRKNCSKIRKP